MQFQIQISNFKFQIPNLTTKNKTITKQKWNLTKPVTTNINIKINVELLKIVSKNNHRKKKKRKGQ